MSPSSTAAGKTPLSPGSAWGFAAANQLLWPGLGTALAKRRTGLLQMGASGAGCLMVIIGLGGYCWHWVQINEQPNWRDPFALTGLLGTGLFLLTWLWALISSLSMIRSARPIPLPPQLPPQA